VAAIAENFDQDVRRRWADAVEQGLPSVDIESGEVHKAVGGYPGRNHRMPICCEVMKRLMAGGDRVISQPESGQGASLVIRYRLPRDSYGQT